jgi:hypothetical protein
MTTMLDVTPTATTGELTTIRFCGVNFTLEALDNTEFEQLYDAVIDHGSDLVERASTWPMHIYADRKEAHKKQLAENSLHLALLDKEADRRKTLPTSTEPQLCPDCSYLVQPIDPNDLCPGCVEVYNLIAEDRAEEPDWASEYRTIYPTCPLNAVYA